MTDLEISKALALAIGYLPEHVMEDLDNRGNIFVFRPETKGDLKTTILDSLYWDGFDYRDPSVIWPIAEKYNCFPMSDCGFWSTSTRFSKLYYADTAAKAVALAVIGANK